MYLSAKLLSKLYLELSEVSGARKRFVCEGTGTLYRTGYRELRGYRNAYNLLVSCK